MRHLTILRGILSQPTPEIPPALELICSVETSDSTTCTVMHLSDSQPDLRHFLRLFFSGNQLNIWALEPTIHQLSAYIHLGQKYGCPQAVALSLAYPKKWYTDTLDAWFDVSKLDPPAFEPLHVLGSPDAPASPGPGARVFAAQARLLHANVRATHRVFGQAVASGCQRAKTCAVVLARLLAKLVDDEMPSSWTTYVVKIDADGEGGRRKLCTHCYWMLTATRPKAELPVMTGVTIDDRAGKIAD
ncbi:hypothetical protein BC628DRAFT_1408252 [Trametes gibbosa]|nr:hypothetical protein BC628DRAFT_1408252 [Trametes gibbosa]